MRETVMQEEWMTQFPMTGALAVVTGAASGIGAGLASALAARGVDLALVDIDTDGLEVTRKTLAGVVRTTLHPMDVTNQMATAGLPDVVAQVHGRPADILVNNAGVALGGTFADVSDTDFNWLMDINLHAPIALTRAFLPMLMVRPAAQIVNISSIFGVMAPPGQTAYCASKFGLRGFSEALRHELLDSPVGVTVVHLSLIHISEPTRLRRISYAVFCLKKKIERNS